MQNLKSSTASLCHSVSGAPTLFLSESALTKIIEIYLPSTKLVYAPPPQKRGKVKNAW
jgi:hypothetical protein